MMNILLLFGGQGYTGDLYSILMSTPLGVAWVNDVSTQLSLNLPQDQLKISDRAWTQRLISFYQLGITNILMPDIKSHDITLAGLSLGEVTAYMYSLGLSIAEIDACLLHRTELMTSICTGSCDYDLVAISGDFDLITLKSWCKNSNCYISIINGENRVVLGGMVKHLNQFILNHANNIKSSQFLSIHLPSHTPYYAEQAIQFERFLMDKFTDKKMQYPILSVISQMKETNNHQEIKLLASELSNTLPWYVLNRMILEYKYDLIIDIGPGRALSSLLKEQPDYHADTKIVSVSDFKSIDGLRHYAALKLS